MKNLSEIQGKLAELGYKERGMIQHHTTFQNIYIYEKRELINGKNVFSSINLFTSTNLTEPSYVKVGRNGCAQTYEDVDMYRDALDSVYEDVRIINTYAETKEE